MRSAKKILRTSILASINIAVNLSTLTAHAGVAGPYIGGQVGYSRIYSSALSPSDIRAVIESVTKDYVAFTSFDSNVSARGDAGRIYAGFQFGDYFATELGWAKFTNLPAQADVTAVDVTTGVPMSITHVSGTIMTDAFDLVAKGILPLPYHFNVYGKAGFAYIETRPHTSALISEGGKSETGSNELVHHRYYPTFGLGLAYDITPNFGADFSWNRIQKIRGEQIIGSTDFYGVGVSYNFGGMVNCCCL